MKTVWAIYDWAGNLVYSDLFDNFDSAEEFLSEILGTSYDTDRQEYEIEECELEFS